MAQGSKFIMAAAVAALTFGVTEQMPTPREHPLSDSDIVIVKNEAAPPAAGQTEENAMDSAKMDEEEGTQSGEAADTAANDTSKIDQPERNPTTSNFSDQSAGSGGTSSQQ